MLLKIELLSDLCVSSGEGYNSFVDTEVVYDEYGLLYIPAKRIKGCIREAALELTQWGLFSYDEYETLFGKEGKEKALFTLDNAYLNHYEGYRCDLAGCNEKKLVHPQRVLNLFTYTRTKTAITKEGVADNGSLRTIRVINKGEEFFANLYKSNDLTDRLEELLKASVSMVKHIGSERTRGLGLVNLTLSEDEGKKQEEQTIVPKPEISGEYGTYNKIHYKITLNSALLCKSAEGSQEKTHDYIEGSKILGVLAQNLSREDFRELMNYSGKGSAVIASNAYICEKDSRYTPITASLQKKKDRTYENGEMEVADMLIHEVTDEQRTPVGSGYVSNDGDVKNVDITINYHHSRTTDKSIGKATGEDGSAFYQMESISKGQQFAGFILADKKSTETVINCLLKASNVRMGYGKNTEYGSVNIEVTRVEALDTKEPRYETEFVVKLNSPMILYNEYGIPCADAMCLKAYLANLLQVDDDSLKLKNAFLNYETVGGFNVTWNRRKPIFTALGKGSVCLIQSKEAVNVALLENAFVGERVSEGYGEIAVKAADSLKDTVILKNQIAKECFADAVKSDITDRLRKSDNREEIRKKAVLDAKNLLENNKSLIKNSEMDAVLNKLILIVKSEEKFEEIKNQAEGIESVSKKELVAKLLKPAEEYSRQEKDVIMFNKDEAVKEYLHSYLNRIKYKVYEEKKGGAC